MRFDLDSSWRRFGSVVLGGSPLRIFRLTSAGERVAEALERADDVDRSTLTDRLLAAGAIHPATGAGSTGHRFAASDVTVVTPQLGGRTAIDDGRITVDDGSRPPLTGATVSLDRNRGPAAARNAARPLVDTDLVAFVDADVDLTPRDGSDWLAPLLPHFDDPQVALVAPRVLGEPDSPLDMGDQPARVRAGSRISYVPAAAVVVRRSALEHVGWFDERLRFGEDVDLVWRLDDAGWTCRYEPTSTVWHAPRPTLAARLRQRFDYGSSAAPLALRHPGKLAPLRTNGWTASSWLLVAIGRPSSAIALAVGSALALPGKLPDLPPAAAIGLALRGHLASARWLADALRREWLPLTLVASLCSRRARLLGAAAFAAAPTRVATDAAYACGIWAGMIRTARWHR